MTPDRRALRRGRGARDVRLAPRTGGGYLARAIGAAPTAVDAREGAVMEDSA